MEGPEGPPGVIDTFRVNVEADQGLIGTSISASYAPTPVPASLTVNVDAGTYLLSWYSEVMRTTAANNLNFFVRMRDATASSSLGFMRHGGTNIANGSPTAIPDEPSFASAGDLLPFAGSMLVTLPAGTHTYRVEYAAASNNSPSPVLRAQHQRISLLRVE
jgi:hypothetical protein